MNAVLVGYGEVGVGVCQVLQEHHNLDIEDPPKNIHSQQTKCDVLLIAIPYNKYFIPAVARYKKRFNPKATVIFSTVPIGTSRKLGAVHSPIEGRHDNMAESFRRFPRWIGGVPEDMEEDILRFFEVAGLRVWVTRMSETTEFMKLQSLAHYGIEVQWERDCKEMADQIGFDYNILKIYNQDYNNLVEANGQSKYRRPIMNHTEGKIGGHCVLPGMALLQDKMNNPFVDRILKENGIDCSSRIVMADRRRKQWT